MKENPYKKFVDQLFVKEHNNLMTLMNQAEVLYNLATESDTEENWDRAFQAMDKFNEENNRVFNTCDSYSEDAYNGTFGDEDDEEFDDEEPYGDI